MADSQDDVDAAQREVDAAIVAAKTHGSLGTTQVADKTASHPAAWTPELVSKLSFGIGIFAIFSLLLVTVLICKRRSPEQVLRTFGILVIIFSAVFLVIAGYSDTQITPVIGLLGTIAGYLLGRRIEPATSEADRRGQREHGEQAAPLNEPKP